jgi:hypothetical protein
MTRTMSFYDLRDALAQSGCAVCRLKTDAADRFLDGLLWESVNDPHKRRKIRRAQGFCYEHSWALVRTSASLGVALIARDVLQDLLKTMEGGTFQAMPPLSLRRVQEALDSKQPAAATAEFVSQLESRTDCPACLWVEKMEGIILNTLVQSLLGEGGLLADYEASDGLCLPHFRQALAQVRKEAVFEALVSAQRTVWERLVGQLSESIRKSDYRFQDEAWGEESGAWLRAIAALVGGLPDKDRRKTQHLWSFKRPTQG